MTAINSIDNLSVDLKTVIGSLANETVEVLGYYAPGDGGGGTFYWDDVSTDDDNGGTIIRPNSISPTDPGRWLRDYGSHINIRWFGAGDGTAAEVATSILAAVSFSLSTTTARTVYIPEGVYIYDDLGNLAYNNFTIKGDGHRKSILKRSDVGVALTIDAFHSSFTDYPQKFIQGFNMEGITVEGNADTTTIIFAQGLARCIFENVFVREASDTVGIGFELNGVNLCSFKNIGCSTDLDGSMTNIPHTGIQVQAGSRIVLDEVTGLPVSESVSPSNNTFYQPYCEGLTIGILLSDADQNYFIGGSPESCSLYGAAISSTSRYNTFIGTGFENDNSTFDVNDAGIYTKYINCYFSKKFNFGSTARGIVIENSYVQAIDIETGAENSQIENVTIGHWLTTPATGIDDLGYNTLIKNVFDHANSVFLKNNVTFNTMSDANDPLTNSQTGGFTPFINTTGSSNFPSSFGVGLGVDRSGAYGDSSSIGSFRIWAEASNSRDLFFQKLVATNTLSPFIKVWTDDFKVATSSDTATPVSASYIQAEVQAILDELRVLKTNMRNSGILQ